MSRRACTASEVPKIAEDIGELVDAAALDPNGWDAVISEMARRLPGTKAVFQVVDRISGVCVPMTLAGWDPAVTDAYAQYYGAMNPWSPIMIGAPEQSILYSEDLLPASAFRATEFYADWLSRADGIDASTGMKIIGSDGRLGVIAFHYDARSAESTNDRAAFVLTALAPRLRRALDVNKACFTTEYRVSTPGSILEAVSDPAFVVTGDLRLQSANARAWHILEDGRLIRIGANDRLMFADAQFADHFRRHVTEALSAALGPVASRPEQRSAVPGRPRHSIFATLLYCKATATVGLDLLFASQPSILVLLKPDASAMADAMRWFRKFGLTPAEIRLALKMDGSRPLAAIAAEIGIGYETARTQRRSAYAKLGISRHAEFIALLLQLTSGF